MSTFFFPTKCRSRSNIKRFGLCDDPPPSRTPAYIDEINGEKWIAVVNNEERKDVGFIGIDNCSELTLVRQDGRSSSRCDGMLYLENTVIFVELKDRQTTRVRNWINGAIKQLEATILEFEKTKEAGGFSVKKAVVANKAQYQVQEGQQEKIARFAESTKGYVLNVRNRIDL